MKLKKAALMFVTAAALAANTIPAFAMGFVHADGGTKYDWGGGNAGRFAVFALSCRLAFV